MLLLENFSEDGVGSTTRSATISLSLGWIVWALLWLVYRMLFHTLMLTSVIAGRGGSFEEPLLQKLSSAKIVNTGCCIIK